MRLTRDGGNRSNANKGSWQSSAPSSGSCENSGTPPGRGCTSPATEMESKGQLAVRAGGLMNGRTSEVLLQRVIVEDSFSHAATGEGGGGGVVSVERKGAERLTRIR